MSKKTFLPAILALAVLAFTVNYASTVSAEETSYPTIVEKLAEKFNLNEEDVQVVFNEVHEEREADMYARHRERLSDLVNEGKITQEQMDALLDKHDQMHDKIHSLRDLSIEERREEMQKIREDYRNFLQNEGYDTHMGFPGYGLGKGMHGGGMRMMGQGMIY